MSSLVTVKKINNVGCVITLLNIYRRVTWNRILFNAHIF
jgi:hypothetical protein